MRPFAVLCVVVALLTASCSNRGIYEGIQTSNRIDCTRLPPSQYDECMQRNDTSYEEYERQRQEAGER